MFGCERITGSLAPSRQAVEYSVSWLGEPPTRYDASGKFRTRLKWLMGAYGVISVAAFGRVTQSARGLGKLHVRKAEDVSLYTGRVSVLLAPVGIAGRVLRGCASDKHERQHGND